jgi:hypothetical protein
MGCNSSIPVLRRPQSDKGGPSDSKMNCGCNLTSLPDRAHNGEQYIVAWPLARVDDHLPFAAASPAPKMPHFGPEGLPQIAGDRRLHMEEGRRRAQRHLHHSGEVGFGYPETLRALAVLRWRRRVPIRDLERNELIDIDPFLFASSAKALENHFVNPPDFILALAAEKIRPIRAIRAIRVLFPPKTGSASNCGICHDALPRFVVTSVHEISPGTPYSPLPAPTSFSSPYHLFNRYQTETGREASILLVASRPLGLTGQPAPRIVYNEVRSRFTQQNI